MRLLNKTTLIKRIYRRLGIGNFKVPFSDDEIFDIIMEDTLPDFSKIYPYYYNLPVSDCKKINEFKYKIPDNDLFRDCSVLGVSKLVLDNRYSGSLGHSPNGLVRYDASGYNGDGLDIIEYATSEAVNMLEEDLSNFNDIPVLPEIEEPNMIILSRPIGLSSNMMFKLHLTHPNLNTIANSMSSTFFKLALLDVKGALYERMKNTTYSARAIGDNSFNIENWANAYEERDELFEELYQNTITEREDTYIRM